MSPVHLDSLGPVGVVWVGEKLRRSPGEVYVELENSHVIHSGKRVTTSLCFYCK